MTLREVCGLTTEAIAHAFLVPPATLAQRIVRAKARIKADRIPYEVPDQRPLRQRLEPVLRVVYLLFTEGYRASAGEELDGAPISPMRRSAWAASWRRSSRTRRSSGSLP